MSFTNQPAVLDALEKVFDLDDDMWFDNAAAFSCPEADALAQLFRAVGNPQLAEYFMEIHAADDDQGDAHFGKVAADFAS